MANCGTKIGLFPKKIVEQYTTFLEVANNLHRNHLVSLVSTTRKNGKQAILLGIMIDVGTEGLEFKPLFEMIPIDVDIDNVYNSIQEITNENTIIDATDRLVQSSE